MSSIPGDGFMQLEVHNAGWAIHPLKLFLDELDLTDGADYKLSFYAKAEAAANVVVKLGETLGGAPWFDEYGSQTIGLTNDIQYFEFTFTVGVEDTASSEIIFEFGNGTLTTFSFADINFVELP